MQDYFKHYCVLKKSIKLYSEYRKDIENIYSLPYEEKRDGDEGLAMQYGIKIKNCFLDEYNLFYDKQYFFGCSFKVYKETYKGRFIEFKKTFFDTEEIDFIIDELNEGIFIHKFMSFDTSYFESFEMQLDASIEKQIQFSLKKRFEFLQQKAKENGYHLIYNDKKNYTLELIKQPLEPKKEDEPLIDYSNSKITEKIIALNELGVLDFLREKEPFNMTTLKLAEYLSLCLGEKTISIYPCINPIFNKTVKQKNNPYETVATVKQTKKNLIQIGVKIE